MAMTKVKFNWDMANLYSDVVLDNGSVKRSKKFITLNKFRVNIESGLSMKDMRRSGISKHLLNFFSGFCQGKINLTKEKFIDCYELGLSLDEISKKYKISRENLTYLRQLYNIKRKGATFIRRKETEESLTPRQREIIYGSLMGDAKRNDKRYGSSVGFGQSEKQEDYLKWKYSELENLASKKSLKRYSNIDKRNGKTYVSWRFYTTANTEIENIISQFYKEDKQITREILDNLTSFSVAVWYMDDGTANFFEKRKKRTCHNITPEVKLCTDSFSKGSCNNIVEWFKDKFGINSHLREGGLNKKGQMKYRVIIDSTSVQDFFSLISPHIIPSMRYKLGE